MVTVPSAASTDLGTQELRPLQIPTQSGASSDLPFGGGVGRQLSEAGRGFEAAANSLLKIQDEEDKARAYEAYSQASEQARGFLNDPDKGIYSRKGSNALTAYKDTLKGLDDISGSTIGNLKTDGAKIRFSELWRVKRENILSSVSRYEVQERNDYKRLATAATTQSAKNDAIENFNNPQFVADSIASGEIAIRDSLAGAPPEAVKIEVEKFRSDIHKGVITRMVGDDALGAKEYYEKHKEQISEPDKLSMEKLLTEGELLATAQSAANEIIRQNPTYEEQRIALKKIGNEDVRVQAEEIIDRENRELQKVTKDEQKQLSAEAWKIVLDTGDRTAIPLDHWVALDEDTQKQIKIYGTRTSQPKTDITRWYELNQMYERDPDKFTELNLMNEVNNLSESDFKDFSKKQEELIGGDKINQLRTRTDLAIVKARLREVGINPEPKQDDAESDRVRAGKFYREFDARKKQFFEDNNRKPNEAEVEQIIDKMLIKGSSDDASFFGGFFGGKDAFSFENLPDFVPEGFDEVPTKAAREIIEAYKKRHGGRIPTDEFIKRVYMKSLEERDNAE